MDLKTPCLGHDASLAGSACFASLQSSVADVLLKAPIGPKSQASESLSSRDTSLDDVRTAESKANGEPQRSGAETLQNLQNGVKAAADGDTKLMHQQHPQSEVC